MRDKGIKICHITKATGVAGSEKYLLTLLASLDKAKYQITLVLLVERNKPLDDYARRFDERGVQVKRVLMGGDVDPLLVWRLYQPSSSAGYRIRGQDRHYSQGAGKSGRDRDKQGITRRRGQSAFRYGNLKLKGGSGGKNGERV